MLEYSSLSGVALKHVTAPACEQSLIPAFAFGADQCFYLNQLMDNCHVASEVSESLVWAASKGLGKVV
jgi:hypothetical protein